jgi:hypothetical protein
MNTYMYAFGCRGDESPTHYLPPNAEKLLPSPGYAKSLAGAGVGKNTCACAYRVMECKTAGLVPGIDMTHKVW